MQVLRDTLSALSTTSFTLNLSHPLVLRERQRHSYVLPDKVKAFTFTLFGIAGGMMADFYFDVFHNGRV